MSFAVVEWPVPGIGDNATDFRGTAQPGPNLGEVTKSFNSKLAGAANTFVEVIARSVVDVSGNRFYFHPLDGEEGFFDQQPLP